MREGGGGGREGGGGGDGSKVRKRTKMKEGMYNLGRGE